MKGNKAAVARLAMIGMIIVSVFFGSYRSMHRLADSVNKVFYEGVDGDGLGIQNDLAARIDLAYNLTTIARNYVSDAEIDPVLSARQALIDAKTIRAKWEANQKLTETTAALLATLETMPLTQKHEEYRERIKADLNSRNTTIGHDGYNDLAMEANRKLNQIPSRWFRRLMEIEEVPLFR